jgi:hypothetical protein
MKVRFAESGGFAGLVKACDLDAGGLPEEEARELARLAAASGISSSGEFFSTSGRDLRQYEITIEAGGRTVAALFDDETLPPAARPLVGFLRRYARPAPPGR